MYLHTLLVILHCTNRINDIIIIGISIDYNIRITYVEEVLFLDKSTLFIL